MDFDEDRMYFSRQNLRGNNNTNDDEDDNGDGAAAQSNGNLQSDEKVEQKVIRRHFREFLRELIVF